ncbi:LysM peptidoglycan-binding domain-containing protein [Amycolatopsis sp. FBCC-B4732]|uniref:BTAD domain-containing putative transcriptional regulator n=1 Tax=Amycolatopsis sp. FBCC-B4732 TaxID=3079339 RepID=UPI001FF41F69|nr:BTAD domain-containing putative transcriptional regulator [Amycolatopsis sp. FBCC-B4732]UOX88408.1 LysM peptidoglycan-binding domain-containing protein [Amycolatopsis sp. FBCC-B4732]
MTAERLIGTQPRRARRGFVRGAERLLQAGAALALLAGLAAGLPWALARFIGWPLPDHLPTTAEIGTVLAAPLSTSLLLDALACGAWLLWGAFLVELAGYVRDLVLAAGRPNLSQRGGPLRRVAAVLITAVVVSFISRTAVAATGGSSPVGAPVAATSAADGRSADIELARPPRDGIHDSLYRIAQRRLDDGDRWPEIWRLNDGSAQPGGRTLTSPSLIHPGDRIRLPPTPRPVDAKPSQQQSPAEPADVSPPPSPASPSAVASNLGSSWEPGVYVGLGLAGAISTAVLVARRRHRAGYRPGSGERGDDLRVAPVVYQLRLAHQRAETQPDELDVTDAEADGDVPELGESADEAAVELALDLASTHGLGLIGPGSHAAARALLLTAMTSTRGTQVVAPAADLRGLLGVPEHGAELPACVHVVADLADALTRLESRDPLKGIREILMARMPTGDPDHARLQRVLADGGPSTTVLLLGQWHPGVTAYVDATGVITATSPGPGETLRGRRAFSLPESATRELFALFDAARDDQPQPALEPTHGLEIAAPPVPEHAEAVPEPITVDNQHAATTPLVLSVFGQPTLSWRPDLTHPDRTVEITGSLSRRLWELLLYLALHPHGVPRAAIIDSVWASRPAQDPAAVLRTVLSRLRSTIHKATSPGIGDLVVAEHGRYRLAPTVVEVDYWSFADAVARRRTTTDDRQRVAANTAIVAGYGGELAAGIETEWITALREGVRRDALDAVAALARGQVQNDPESTLELLESARDFDPHNELLYRDIMRLEHNLGRHDAIPRTLRLLEARLAEIDETPTPTTIELAEHLGEISVSAAEIPRR